MRGLLMACAVTLALMAVVPASSNAAVANDGGTLAPSAVYALQQPSAPTPKVDINVTHSGGGRWYANPVWIAIGAVAVVVILLLIVLVARGGGGTTIVRE